MTKLGINAGLQDRVAQVYEGCVYMDFDKEYLTKHKHGKYEPLNPVLLPNLYIAYKTELGKVSGAVFNDIKARFYKGDEKVISTINEIASLAAQGKEALLNKDIPLLNELINRNFDLRCQIMNVSDSNKELVNTARNCGASAKFTGSGGSIIGIYPNDEVLNKLVVDLKKIKARVIKPYII